MRISLASTVLLVACGGRTISTVGLHKNCATTACEAGQTCVSYHGFGADSSQQSCEIPCPDGVCPQGLVCYTVSDGPGKVCEVP